MNGFFVLVIITIILVLRLVGFDAKEILESLLTDKKCEVSTSHERSELSKQIHHCNLSWH